MGLLEKIFGHKDDFPPLPANSEAGDTIIELREPLEELVHKVHGHLEVVPADHEAFVFLGHPPKRFGVAWIHDGQVTGLREFAQEHDLSEAEMGKLLVKLGEAYQHASEMPRYTTEVAGKQMVVIPSKGLEQEMHQILEETHH